MYLLFSRPGHESRGSDERVRRQRIGWSARAVSGWKEEAFGWSDASNESGMTR